MKLNVTVEEMGILYLMVTDEIRMKKQALESIKRMQTTDVGAKLREAGMPLDQIAKEMQEEFDNRIKIYYSLEKKIKGGSTNEVLKFIKKIVGGILTVETDSKSSLRCLLARRGIKLTRTDITDTNPKKKPFSVVK